MCADYWQRVHRSEIVASDAAKEPRHDTPATKLAAQRQFADTGPIHAIDTSHFCIFVVPPKHCYPFTMHRCDNVCVLQTAGHCVIPTAITNQSNAEPCISRTTLEVSIPSIKTVPSSLSDHTNMPMRSCFRIAITSTCSPSNSQ